MTKSLTSVALAVAMTGSLALAAPAAAAATAVWQSAETGQAQVWNHGRRHRGHHDGNYGGSSYRSYGDNDRYDDDRYEDRYEDRRRYDEPVYRGSRVWRGDDGRAYCRRSDGTTGLLIGGAAGALLGREVAGRRGDRTLGAILGAAGGALIGREIDRGGSRCR
jgi:hypothetical protein